MTPPEVHHALLPGSRPTRGRRVQPLIWVHGTGDRGADELAPLRSALAGRFAPDLWLICPSFETPYQFLIPGLDRHLIDWVEGEAGRQGFSEIRPWIVGGFSGGAQFAHRFALRHGERLAGCLAFAAGSWTTPDGRCIGMMPAENWFDAPPWSDPRVARAAQRPAERDAWTSIKWRVGCGSADHPERLSSAGEFYDALRRAGCDASYLAWDAGHDMMPRSRLATLLQDDFVDPVAVTP